MKAIVSITVLLVIAWALAPRVWTQGQQPVKEGEPDNGSKANSRLATSNRQSNVTEIKLDNGLKVLLKEVHTTPLVSVWCWYRVGSKDEQIGATGISHWVEHMNFKGTQSFSKDQVKSLIESAGGYWNGYTFLDQTAYFETVASGALEEMLKLEAERMTLSLFDPQEVKSERTVVISELQGAENDPKNLLDIDVTAAAFKIHPYRWPTVGWLRDLQTITREQLYQYYRRYYVPNNAVLVLVGDFQTQAALELVKKYFARIPRQPDMMQINISEPEQEGERRIKIVRQGATHYLQIAYRTPDILNDDFYALLLLDAVLNGAKGINLWSSPWNANASKSSRLYKALIDKKLATHVNSNLIATQSPYLYKLTLTLPDSFQYQPAEEAVYDELGKLKNYELTDYELSKAKNQLVARTFLDQDSLTKLAHQLGYFESIASFGILNGLEERINRVTKEDLRRVAGKYFAETARTVGWFVPIKEAQKIEIEKLSANCGLQIAGGFRPANLRFRGKLTLSAPYARVEPVRVPKVAVSFLRPSHHQSGSETGFELGGISSPAFLGVVHGLGGDHSADEQVKESPLKGGQRSGRSRWNSASAPGDVLGAAGLSPQGHPPQPEGCCPPPGGIFTRAQVSSPAAGGELASDELPSMKSRPTISIKPQRKVLSNGISIIVAENNTGPTLTIKCSMKAGAMRDSDEKAGIAHFVGQMLQHGTKTKSIYQLAEGFDFLGATLSTDTDYLVTSITVDGLKKDAKTFLQFLAEMFQTPSFPQAEVEKVRTEILTELRRELDDTQLMAELVLRERIYSGGHPFRRKVKGSLQSIEKLKLQDLTSFHKAYYRPDQLVIVVAGDIKAEEIFQLVENSFGGWSVRGVAEAFSIPAASAGLGMGQQVVTMNHKSQCDIIFGFTGISRRHPDYYSMLVLNQILGRAGLGGRLGTRIRDQEGLAYYTYSSFDASLSEGPFVIRAGVNPNRVDRAVTLLKEEMQKIKAHGVTEAEVESAKRYLIHSLPVKLESNEGIAKQLLNIELFDLGEDYLNRFADLIEAVTMDTLKDLLRARLRFDQAALVIVGPYNPK